jgi:SOS response regulatory protein OraA/RecX
MSEETSKQAKNYALYLLAMREYSQKLIIQKIKLRYKDISNTQIDQIITYLIESNYLSNTRYAQAKTRQLFNKFYGKSYILQKLKEDGIDNLTSEKAIIESLQELKLNCAPTRDISWLEQIKIYLEKYKYDFLESDYNYQQKWKRKLYQRGFDISDIMQVLTN